MHAPQAAILATLWLLAPCALSQVAMKHPERETLTHIRTVPWSFVDDFSHGIGGWMSFPLAQDIGYDPSLYTTSSEAHSFLVRDVIANGQPKLRVGVLRSICFRLLPQSTIRLRYRIAMTGRPRPARLFAAATSGKQYAIAIPSTAGKHAVTVDGTQLGVTGSGEQIEALVVQFVAVEPSRGAHNRLFLDELDIHARRNSSISLDSPALDEPAGDGLPVAKIIVHSERPVLPLQLASPKDQAVVVLIDGSGQKIYRSAARNGGIDLGPSPAPGLWRAHISTAEAESDFRFLVLGNIPPHPRLLLTPERLEELRSQMPSDALRRLVQEHALRAASLVSPDAEAGNDILRMPTGSLFPGLTQYFDLLDRYGEAIVLDALDFRLRNSHESLQTARLALLAAARWPTWTPPWFPAHGLQSYYEAGIFSQDAALGYDLIADQLSPTEKREIADAFYRNAILPAVTDYFADDRMPIADSNHMAHTISGAIAACIAVYGDVPDWDERFGPALAKLIAAEEQLFATMFPDDGSEAEPVGYQEFAMRGLSIAAAALAHAGIQPQGTARMFRSFWWPYYAQYKPGYELDTGDEIGTLFSHSGFAWAAATSVDPVLRSFYQAAKTGTLAALFRAGPSTSGLPSMLDLTCCTNPLGPAPLPPLSRMFPARGSAALRSGWDDSSTLVSIRVGPWFNHGHHDEGSFQIASHGEVLIGEAGYTAYYKDPRFEDYFTQAVGHNTVVIDHNAFSQTALESSRWAAFAHYPRFTRHLLGEGMDFLEADLRPAYPDSNLSRYTRQYVFIKPGFVFVHDRLSSSTSQTYSFLLHPGAALRPTIEDTTAFLQGNQASALVVAGTSAGPWQTSPAPIPVTAYINFEKNLIQPRNTLHLDTLPARAASFTVGIQLLPPPSDGGRLKSISTKNADGFSIKAAQTEILFRKRVGELSIDTYATDGDVLAAAAKNGQETIFTENAHQLHSHRQELFSAVQPIDAEIVREAGHDDWLIFSTRRTSVQLTISTPLKSATLDGKPLLFSAADHLLRLTLQSGEHRVNLQY